MNEFNYYVIDRASDEAYPLIAPQDDSRHTMLYSMTKNKIDTPERVQYKFCDPIPRKPVIGDYFSEPESVVSRKIADVLEPMHIDGIQLIPAEIKTNTGEILENYFYIHIYNHIKAIDRNKSEYEVDDYDPDFFIWIDSFELDREVLAKIPREKRLIFKLRESSTTHLYHESIVQAIKAVNPKGVSFTKVEDWYFKILDKPMTKISAHFRQR